jgi:hypothetical protein
MPLAVHEQSDAVKAMAREWPLLAALLGGTPAMRAAGERFLPKWPGEEQASYAARLATATLFPAYRRTVGVMSGKPFAKAVTLGDDVPAAIKTWAENIDLHGRNLTAFAADVCEEAIGYGLSGVLVDYPDTAVRDASGQPIARPARTVAQVEAQGLRPYWVHIRHEQVLGWQATLSGGVMRLTQLRLLESVEEPDGPFGTTCVQQVRVLEPGRWATYRKPDKATEFVLYQQGTTTLSVIPFVPFYGKRTGFMQGVSPLLDLAYLNVKHWQSQSDQDTILHVARVPILAVSGVDDETWQLSLGAQTAVKLPSDASMEFVEHSGASIEAGAKSLADLEQQMIQTGAELLVKTPGDRSATEAAGDQEANKCDLQRMAEAFEDALDACLQLTADYAQLGSGGSASLFKDFGVSTLSEATAQTVLSLQAAGMLSKKTTIAEMQRRGVLEASVDPDVEIAEAEAEGPAPGEMVDEDEAGE